MAKTRVTKKWVMNNFDKVICVPYCALQRTLRDYTPAYYTAGVYGWNADIYIIDNNIALCTGYRPFGNIRITHEEAEKLEKDRYDLGYLKMVTAARQVNL